MTSLFGPIAAFVAVLAMIPVALWLLKRTPLGAAASTAGAMRVVTALTLAPNQRLVTVEVGSGDDRRWLVLGVTPGSINTLHSLPPQAAPVVAAMPMSSFAQMLSRSSKGAAPGTEDQRAS